MVRRSSFELQAADILLTTLLARNMFPSPDTLDDLMTATYQAPQRRDFARPAPTRQAHDRDEKSDENEEVFICVPMTQEECIALQSCFGCLHSMFATKHDFVKECRLQLGLLEIYEGGSFSTAIFNSDIQLSFFSFSCFISVCPFVALLKATYAENMHIALSCRY